MLSPKFNIEIVMEHVVKIIEILLLLDMNQILQLQEILLVYLVSLSYSYH